MLGRLAVTISLLLLAAPAHADNTSDAREFYERGAYHYQLQHWEAALDAFEAAFGARHDPETLFNIAQCQRQLGRNAAAAHSYRAYLAAAPDGDSAATAARYAALMEATAAPLPPGPKAPIGETRPQASVTINGAVADHAHGRSRPWYRRPAGMVTAAVGLATALAGGALMAAGANSDAAAARADTLPAQNRLWNAGGELRTGGIVALAIGGAGIIVGGVLLRVRR